ncbi:MAG TPA: hypothetical protein DCQ04_11910 [Actinobacteria bacterium]|nr:hypothetical protein [Actinomycetota bacterium]
MFDIANPERDVVSTAGSLDSATTRRRARHGAADHREDRTPSSGLGDQTRERPTKVHASRLIDWAVSSESRLSATTQAGEGLPSVAGVAHRCRRCPVDGAPRLVDPGG